jgi:hypothetical protein
MSPSPAATFLHLHLRLPHLSHVIYRVCADNVGQTREKQKTSRLLLQVLNHSVSPTTRHDSESSQRVRTRNVSSVVKRQRGGLFSEGVSLVPLVFASVISSGRLGLMNVGY